MGVLNFIAGLIVVIAVQTPVSPDLVKLGLIKAKARSNLTGIPDYVCTETIERFKRLTKMRRPVQVDTIRVEVAEVGEQELFAWPGARRLGETNIVTVVGAGAIGTGTFAAYARNVLTTDGPTFQYAGEEKLDGRRVMRYDYRVSQLVSTFVLSEEKQRVVVAYSGSFWVDPTSFDLVRISAQAEDIPPQIAISAGRTTIDYGRVRIGETSALLPARAELVVERAYAEESRNITRFQDCRKYSAESAISFEDLPAVSQKSHDNPLDVVLPAGLELSLRLETPIDSQRSAVGDAIQARLDAPALQDGKEVAPRGATVRGRIRALGRVPEIGNCFTVGVEFSEIEFANTTARFAADLEGMGRLSGASLKPVCAAYAPFGYASSRSRSRNFVLVAVPTRKIPGVSEFFISTERVAIPRAFRMTWRTVEKQ